MTRRGSPIIGAIALVALAVGGCDRAPSQPRTVDFFKAHDAERAAAVTRCSGIAFDSGSTTDCENARRADHTARLRSGITPGGTR